MFSPVGRTKLAAQCLAWRLVLDSVLDRPGCGATTMLTEAGSRPYLLGRADRKRDAAIGGAGTANGIGGKHENQTRGTHGSQGL